MPDPALEIEHSSDVTPLVLAMADYAAAAFEHACALDSARHCLIDALRRGFETLREPGRAALIGPLVPGALMPGGARVPGTSLELEPAQAAFCIGLMLGAASDDHWLSAAGRRIADPLGAILAAADYQARKATMEGKPPPKVRDVLTAMLKAVEIQGTLAALDASHHELQPVPLRHARAAVSAVVAAHLGGTTGQIARAISYACLDGEMWVDPRTRHASGRADWITADTIGRAVRHACHATAPGRPAFLTPEDLELVELAGSALGGRPTQACKPFGSALIDRLAAIRNPQELAQLTAGLQAAVDALFPPRQAARVKALFATPERLDELPVNELIAALVTNGAR